MGEDKNPSVVSNAEQGVFVAKGMQLSIPHFALKVTDNGTLEIEDIALHTGLDMCPYWIEIALAHVFICGEVHNKLLLFHRANDSEGKASALREEFVSGMQAMISSCIAIDAYYANLRGFIDLPERLADAWKRNRTARHKQIFEVFKIAFVIPGNVAPSLRVSIAQMFDARNKAVHPPSGTKATLRYPELNQDTDWRYATYRYENAYTVLRNSLELCVHTARKPKKRFAGLATYCQTFLEAISPLIARWEEHFGRPLSDPHISVAPPGQSGGSMILV